MLLVNTMNKLLLLIAFCFFVTAHSASALDPITVDIAAPELCGGFDLANNGSKLLYRQLSNSNTKDLYIYDQISASSSLISPDVNAYGAMDDSGRYLVYGSGDDSKAYIHDLTLQSKTEIAQGKNLVRDIPI
jgi:hypothetical protein